MEHFQAKIIFIVEEIFLQNNIDRLINISLLSFLNKRLVNDQEKIF